MGGLSRAGLRALTGGGIGSDGTHEGNDKGLAVVCKGARPRRRSCRLLYTCSHAAGFDSRNAGSLRPGRRRSVHGQGVLRCSRRGCGGGAGDAWLLGPGSGEAGDDLLPAALRDAGGAAGDSFGAGDGSAERAGGGDGKASGYGGDDADGVADDGRFAFWRRSGSGGAGRGLAVASGTAAARGVGAAFHLPYLITS